VLIAVLPARVEGRPYCYAHHDRGDRRQKSFYVPSLFPLARYAPHGSGAERSSAVAPRRYVCANFLAQGARSVTDLDRNSRIGRERILWRAPVLVSNEDVCRHLPTPIYGEARGCLAGFAQSCYTPAGAGGGTQPVADALFISPLPSCMGI